jgi:hypothetical protein
MVFELDDAQKELLKEWDAEHKECRKYASTDGGRLVFTFIPTGLGMLTTVKCSVCGEDVDLTDENF